MSTKLIRIGFKGQVKTVALHSGLDPQELTSLLQTVFSNDVPILGLMSDDGLVVPIATACRSPEILPSSICTLLFQQSKENVSNETKAITNTQESDKSFQIETIFSGLSNFPDVVSIFDISMLSLVKGRINSFGGVLLRQHIIDDREYATLLKCEFRGLLFAAFSVARSTNDVQYLAEICREIGQTLQSREGFLACEAQEEVLQVCDQLFQAQKVSLDQLLYLRHLVLTREEAVASIYDDFQDSNDLSALANSLCYLARRSPSESTPSNEVEDFRTLSSVSDDLRGAQDLLKDMVKRNIFSEAEGKALLSMVASGQEYVWAAIELYSEDGNLQELQDTLLRCVRLEMKKQEIEARMNSSSKSSSKDVNDSLSRTWSAESADSMDVQPEVSHFDDESEDEDEEIDEDSESEDEESSSSSTSSSSEEDAENADIVENLLDLSKIQSLDLREFLSALSLDEKSLKKIPIPFLSCLFVASSNKLISLEETKKICKWMEDGNELVRAAWEVYTVQEDLKDFLDSLIRISRLIDTTQSASPPKAASSSPSKGSTTTKGSPSKSAAAATSTSSSEADATLAANEDRRQQALAAVVVAKRELLDHSLQMLTKQGCVSEEGARDLRERARKGDVMVDAAIESYAADRNVNEFLDTLRVLANNSPEDIENMMSSVRKQMEEEDFNEDEEEEKDEKKDQNDDNDDNDDDDDEDDDVDDDNDNDDQSDDNDDNDIHGSKSLEGEYNDEDSIVARIEIRQIIFTLIEQRAISTEAAAVMLRLLNQHDDKLFAAYDVYQDTKDVEDFVDSLLRIAYLEMSTGYKPSKSGSENKESDENDDNGEEESDDDDEDDENDNDANDVDAKGANTYQGCLDDKDKKAAIDILSSSGAINDVQVRYLYYLIDQKDATIQSLFLEYEQEKDALKLINCLKELSSSFLAKSKGIAKDAGEDEDEDDDEEDDDDDEEGEEQEESENDENEATLNEEDESAITTRFENIIASMGLSGIEVSALRLALARNDSSIQIALSNFKNTLDENKLASDLRLVARKIILTTLVDQGYTNVAQEDDDQMDYETSKKTAYGDADEEIDVDDEEDDDEEEDDDDDEEDDDEEESEEDDEDPISQSHNVGANARPSLLLSPSRILSPSFKPPTPPFLSPSAVKKDFPPTPPSSSSMGNFSSYGSASRTSSGIPSQTPPRPSPNSTGRGYESMSSPSMTASSPARNISSSSPYANSSTYATSAVPSSPYAMMSPSSRASSTTLSSPARPSPARPSPAKMESDDSSEEDDHDDEEDDDEEDDDNNNKNNNDDDDNQMKKNNSTGVVVNRALVFPVLIRELVNENILEKSDGAILLRKFEEGSEVINAAIDVYDVDNDMSELVETLQRVVVNDDN